MTGTTRPHAYPCNCQGCRDSDSAYARHRRRMRAYGRWHPCTEAAPVRQHVRSLMAAGIGIRRTAALAGVPYSTVKYLLYGQPWHGFAPPQRIRTRTAGALLAVSATETSLMPGAVVGGCGTQRRLQALATLGWSLTRIAAQLGMTASQVTSLARAEHQPTAGTARKIRDLYAQMENKRPPEGTKGERVSASKARAYAAQQEWAPPAAWDRIDDPADRPQGVLHQIAARQEQAA